jgi:hypothetical protein
VLPESNNSLNASRATLGEAFVPPESGSRHRADPGKTGFIEAARRAAGIQQLAQRAGSDGVVTPKSGSRHRADPGKTGFIEAAQRAAGIQQLAQCFACDFGRGLRNAGIGGPP